jgi:hypothetical protein
VSTPLLRWLVVAAVLVLLGRAALAAWHHRQVSVALWRAIRVRHVAGSLVLLGVVGTIAVSLLWYVPPTRFGLGSFVGFTGNAVFAPVEEAATRVGPTTSSAPDLLFPIVVSVFLLALLVIVPWLAYVEEEVFRAGLESTGVGGQLRAALVFGLAHLVMLVPLAAALAIGVAGFVYGRVYRRAYRAGRRSPDVARSAFRPTRRSAAAAARASEAGTEGRAVTVAARVEDRQADAVFASAVWHTAFNSLVVLLVWLSLLLA